MASLTQWTWVWVNSRNWWWTGRLGVLRFMGWQRVVHDWATELNWTECSLSLLHTSVVQIPRWAISCWPLTLGRCEIIRNIHWSLLLVPATIWSLTPFPDTELVNPLEFPRWPECLLFQWGGSGWAPGWGLVTRKIKPWLEAWNQNCWKKYQQPQICRWDG